MGTSWAVNALLQSLPVQAGRNSHPSVDVAPAEQAEWAPIALSGSAAELKKLLDGKMSPNAKTAAGTTALMFAARDPEKVKLLLSHGAEVNARAATGMTALMVAARYRGNAEVVRLLLAKGAKPNAEGEVRNDASALFFAAMAGDVQTAKALVEAGAKPDQKMKLLGQFVSTPLLIAAANDDVAMVEFLIGRGANPNDVDADGLTALDWATLTNHAGVVQALLKGGAQVNHVDNFGMTPLLYAASVDFGDTAVLEKLMASGADLKAKNKRGQTALDLARTFNYAKAASLLSNKIASR
jgi:ankyrin repeat protein